MAEILFKIVFAVEFVAVLFVRGYWVRRVSILRGRRQDARATLRENPAESALMFLSFLGMQIFPLIYLFTGWLDFAAYPMPAGLRWLGVALFAGGIALLWRAHADLGAFWSARLETGEEGALVTGGVFARIRHPMYAAHLLWAAGQALLLPNWLAGALYLLVQLPLYALRVPREERLLLERFGDEYRAYRKRTGRFFPRLG